jgi:hypothetical protein
MALQWSLVGKPCASLCALDVPGVDVLSHGLYFWLCQLVRAYCTKVQRNKDWPSSIGISTMAPVVSEAQPGQGFLQCWGRLLVLGPADKLCKSLCNWMQQQAARLKLFQVNSRTGWQMYVHQVAATTHNHQL